MLLKWRCWCWVAIAKKIDSIPLPLSLLPIPLPRWYHRFSYPSHASCHCLLLRLRLLMMSRCCNCEGRSSSDEKAAKQIVLRWIWHRKARHRRGWSAAIVDAAATPAAFAARSQRDTALPLQNPILLLLRSFLWGKTGSSQALPAIRCTSCCRMIRTAYVESRPVSRWRWKKKRRRARAKLFPRQRRNNDETRGHWTPDTTPPVSSQELVGSHTRRRLCMLPVSQSYQRTNTTKPQPVISISTSGNYQQQQQPGQSRYEDSSNGRFSASSTSMYSNSSTNGISTGRSTGGGFKTWLRRLSRLPQMVCYVLYLYMRLLHGSCDVLVLPARRDGPVLDGGGRLKNAFW